MTVVMELVVAPVFQRSAPVEVVDKTELPQLFATFTVGVGGVVFGFAVALPVALVHPLTVWVTVFTPAVRTVILDVVDPDGCHNNVPVAVVDKIDWLLQKSTSVTTGVAGVLLGDADCVPAALVHPLIVVVTLYVPLVVAVIVFVVAPVLHSNEPAAPVDNVEVLLQLSTSVTVGAEGVVFGLAAAEP